MHNERPKVGLGIYIFNSDNKLLLLKRQGSHGAGTWTAPGGHLEYGQSFLDCARMEAMEESGLRINEIEVLGVTNDIFESEGKHYITVHCLALSWEGEAKIMEKEKCLDMGWFSLDELPEPLFLSDINFFKTGILQKRFSKS